MSNNKNMFETATRAKLRFSSSRGPLSVEQLWDVPLRSKDGFDLNAIAKFANGEVKSATEENFVDADPAMMRVQARVDLVLDIVKFVIETKLDEEQTAKTRANNKIERDRLLEILAKKQDDKLGNMSEKEIQKRLEALEV